MLSRRRFTVPLPDGASLALGERVLVMGVINVTPDSFSDGGRLFDQASAIEAGVRMEEEGADLIDVGGESTRPGAEPLDEVEERRRVLPVVEALAGRVRVPVSVDTYRASTAAAALAVGAALVNIDRAPSSFVGDRAPTALRLPASTRSYTACVLVTVLSHEKIAARRNPSPRRRVLRS